LAFTGFGHGLGHGLGHDTRNEGTTDRLVKSAVYARGAIPEYWLIDLPASAVEVYRGPEDGAYTSFARFDAQAVLCPLAFPDLALAVRDILPSL
jgi:Uma2 family endonuclease